MKVLLPFHDDSTLLFAAKLMRFMSAYPIELVPVEVSRDLNWERS